MNNSLIIKTTGLSYSYSKESQALTDINLEIPRGSIYGFLGPNGSGKTTTLSLLLGLLKNREGTIEIFGRQLHSHRMEILKKTGSLIGSPSLYAHLTAIENLEVYRLVYGASTNRMGEVLRIAGLAGTGKKTVAKFSLGMKQRLAIALALLPDPELLILDEPSNGLDPSGIIELRELIQTLNKTHGTTIIISSHLLSEVEKLVSDVGIIYRGKMLFQGPLPGLHAFQKKRTKLLINTSDNEKATRLLQAHLPERSGDNIALPFENISQVNDINKMLTSNGLEVYLLHPQENTLEQLFVDLTNPYL